MDTGTWTFRCRTCESSFELLLTERERAGDFASDKHCPSCGSVPSEASDRRHKIIGYRAQKSRPVLL